MTSSRGTTQQWCNMMVQWWWVRCIRVGVGCGVCVQSWWREKEHWCSECLGILSLNTIGTNGLSYHGRGARSKFPTSAVRCFLSKDSACALQPRLFEISLLKLFSFVLIVCYIALVIHVLLYSKVTLLMLFLLFSLRLCIFFSFISFNFLTVLVRKTTFFLYTLVSSRILFYQQNVYHGYDWVPF